MTNSVGGGAFPPRVLPSDFGFEVLTCNSDGRVFTDDVVTVVVVRSKLAVGVRGVAGVTVMQVGAPAGSDGGGGGGPFPVFISGLFFSG